MTPEEYAAACEKNGNLKENYVFMRNQRDKLADELLEAKKQIVKIQSILSSAVVMLSHGAFFVDWPSKFKAKEIVKQAKELLGGDINA